MLRSKQAGNRIADALIEFLHLMDNKKTAMRVLNGIINTLIERKKEFVNYPRMNHAKAEE